MSKITVYTAKKIHTMNPSLPVATAVAVREGKILEVGELENMQPWLEAHPHVIDEQFGDQVLMPGFIDPHLHPAMAAILLPMQFITAMEWRLPWATVPPVRSHDDFVRQLKICDQQMVDAAEPLFTWGYHQIWHGEMSREILNQVSRERPVIAWQRSFHELYLNDAALKWLELEEGEIGRHPQIDIDKGRFFETGMAVATARMNPFLLGPERFRDGLKRLKQVTHFGGHTTIGDMAAGIFDLEMEWGPLTEILDTDDTPFRVHLVPRGLLKGDTGGAEGQLEKIKKLPARNTHRLQFRDHVKLFTDGGFFAELMQLQEPGFIDGHHGEWLMPPEIFEAAARVYWHAGYKIHVHCTGDLGLELALDVLEKLQWERPRFNHRYTIEHLGVSTPEQIRRMADLGAIASVNIYYVYELGEAYWQHSIGHERASQMARLGTLARHNVTTALHSDYTMAPALPLNNAWVAANRIGSEGGILAPEERLSLYQAMRAITYDAAYVLGMEHEVGSIRAGKMADFTVLRQDPFEEPVENLKDIPIWGTIFEGRPFEIGT